MEMTGQQQISAPRERVWAGLNDAEVLRQCIPGCETLDKLSDTRMQATARIKIGPIAARFGGDVTLSELDPPNSYRITGEGQGGVAGFARGTALVTLEGEGEETTLHYTVEAQVGGKLAQLGSRMIDATARQMAGAFFVKFAATLAGPGDLASPVSTAITPAAKSIAPTPAASPAASPAGTSDRYGWFAPVIALLALALLAWDIFVSDRSRILLPDHGVMVLALVGLACAIGYLFGQRSR